jgi:hypothetical protein
MKIRWLWQEMFSLVDPEPVRSKLPYGLGSARLLYGQFWAKNLLVSFVKNRWVVNSDFSLLVD